jgi:hypothetical protein
LFAQFSVSRRGASPDTAILSEEAKRCYRRSAGAVFIWDNRETQTAGLKTVEA